MAGRRLSEFPVFASARPYLSHWVISENVRSVTVTLVGSCRYTKWWWRLGKCPGLSVVCHCCREWQPSGCWYGAARRMLRCPMPRASREDVGIGTPWQYSLLQLPGADWCLHLPMTGVRVPSWNGTLAVSWNPLLSRREHANGHYTVSHPSVISWT